VILHRVNPKGELRPGIRVKVSCDPAALDVWPTEPTGYIELFLGEDCFVVSENGKPIRHFLVMFDEAHDDGSGDGPYFAATIDERRLERIGEGELDRSPRGDARRAQLDAMFREVNEHPERSERIR
jgi:hypothetical protein